MKFKLIIAILTLFTPYLLLAQEESHPSSHIEKKHKATFFLSHTHIGEGIKNGKNEWLIVPSFGFDYNYSLTAKWSIGLHNDMVVENFKVQKINEEFELERTRPFSSSVVAGFKPGKSFTYEIGFGGEFAQEGTLFFSRIGIEYSREISEDLELVSNLVYDIKWNHFNSYVLGIGISKSF